MSLHSSNAGAAPVAILVIGSDAAIEQALTRSAANRAGVYQLARAESVHDARLVLAACAFDLIITEDALPDGTAFDLLAVFGDQPVLLLTDAGNEDRAATALARGVHEYLMCDAAGRYLTLLPHRVETALGRLRLERQLRDTQSQLRAILDAAPVPLALTDAARRFAFVNPAFESTFGYPLPEIPTLADWGAKAFPDADYRQSALDRWNPAASDAADPRPPLSDVELLDVKRKDGTVVTVQTEVVSLDRALAGSQLAVFIDVTARRHAERGLRQSRLRLRGILDSMFVFVGLCSLDGVVLEVNRARLVAGRARREDVIDRPLWEAPGFSHSTVSQERLRDAIARAGRGEVVRGDFEVHFETAEVGWIDLIFGPLRDESGQILRVVASGTDVTERVRASQTLRDERDRFTRIAASVPGAICSFRLRRDGSTCFPYASPTIEKIFGLSAEALVDDSAEMFARVHPADIAALRSSLAESAGALLPWYQQYRFRHPERGVIWVEGHAIPVREPHGDVSWHGIVTDITVRKQQELAHEKLRTQLQHAQKLQAVGQLAGGVAHDFNNLLTVVNGRAEYGLMHSQAGDPMRKVLLQIHDAGVRATALTQQLLSVSGNQVTHAVVLSLHTLIANMRALVENLVGDHIALDVVSDAAIGSVRADPVQIEQLIMNLCVNARDAMPRGGTLTIEVRDLDIDDALAAQHPPASVGPHVELAVRDTGVGMDAAVRERIFEPFFTTKPTGKGSGLGLAVVYRIVHQSGASIWVDSAPGLGTTFHVYFPRLAERPAIVPQAAVEASAEPGGETIFIVDDEVEVAELARDILEADGYTIVTANSGEDALAALATYQGPVHLVLSDVTMRGMSGVELMNELARIHPNIRVLLTSGFRDDTMIRHEGLDPNVPFLGKPYSASELRRAVRKMLVSPGGHAA